MHDAVNDMTRPLGFFITSKIKAHTKSIATRTSGILYDTRSMTAITQSNPRAIINFINIKKN